VIIGASPASSSCAIKLNTRFIYLRLLDKQLFTGKTCGDALSVDVAINLAYFRIKVAEKTFKKLENKMLLLFLIVRMVSTPNQSFVDIPFIHKTKKNFSTFRHS